MKISPQKVYHTCQKYIFHPYFFQQILILHSGKRLSKILIFGVGGKNKRFRCEKKDLLFIRDFCNEISNFYGAQFPFLVLMVKI